jgi:hypothetical protein
MECICITVENFCNLTKLTEQEVIDLLLGRIESI